MLLLRFAVDARRAALSCVLESIDPDRSWLEALVELPWTSRFSSAVASGLCVTSRCSSGDGDQHSEAQPGSR